MQCKKLKESDVTGSASGSQIGWYAGYPPCAPPDLLFALLYTALHFRKLIFLDCIIGLPCHWPLVVLDQWEPLTEDLRT